MSLIRYHHGGTPVTRRVWLERPSRLPDLFADDFFERFFADAGVRGTNGMLARAVDLTEDDEAFLLTAELPGVDREAVSIEIHDGVLKLAGERASEDGDDGGSVRLRERRYGSFQRSFRLPDNVQADKIEAGMKDGVLTITVPKAEERKPRQIEVQA